MNRPDWGDDPFGSPKGGSPKPESSHYPRVDRAIEEILGSENLTPDQSKLLKNGKMRGESKVWDWIAGAVGAVVVLAVVFSVIAIAVGITVRMIRWGFGI